eukprot:CAMPEP_0170206086 /NCGR_PEP_ID=MMETSP0116_2-20130129/2593_1 /TAXON_ID=400756 /ORGANISM="Durinskia baltica, Strain CSIRO CS-38" /LENGTH=194 /DNA_ID=CAMNT_0010456489 /DNA_START=113 /DNA_END=697 /DNA_ORIENTATION=+
MSQGDENRNQDQQDRNQDGSYRSWWQFWKSSNNNDDQNGNARQGEEGGAPWWYFWGNDRRMEEEGGRGVLTFIYVWTILLLFALGYFGNRFVMEGNYNPLHWIIWSFTNYAFIVMVLVSGLGAIHNEGREIEETGWYGQLSVLIFLTCMFGIVQSLFFQIWLYRKSRTGKVIESRQEEHLHQEKRFELLEDSLA